VGHEAVNWYLFLCTSISEPNMTGERKHAILLAAALLCARKPIETIDSDRPNLAKQHFVDRAIGEAEFTLARIDKRHPQT